MAKERSTPSLKPAAIVLAQSALLAAILLYAATGLSPFEIAGITALSAALTCLAMLVASKPSPDLAPDDRSDLPAPRLHADLPASRSRANLKEIAAQAYEMERLSGGHIARIVEAAAIDADRQNEIDKITEDQARETEAEPLRTVVNALDAGLRRLAAGDLSVRLDQPFSKEFEGLRADFNRALTAVEDVLAETGADVRALHTNCATTRDGFLHAADSGARQAAALARIITETGSLCEILRSRRMQAGHTAHIAYTAETDMRRPKEAIATALASTGTLRTTSPGIEQAAEIIRDVAFRANMIAVDAAAQPDETRGARAMAQDIRVLAERATEAAKDISLLARTTSEAAETTARSVEKAHGEIEAIGIYTQALKDHVQIIAASTNQEIEIASTIRTTLMAICKASHDQVSALDELAGRIGGLERQAEALDNHAGRFAPAVVVAPGAGLSEGKGQQSHKPESGGAAKKAHPHLRLVKS